MKNIFIIIFLFFNMPSYCMLAQFKCDLESEVLFIILQVLANNELNKKSYEESFLDNENQLYVVCKNAPFVIQYANDGRIYLIANPQETSYSKMLTLVHTVACVSHKSAEFVKNQIFIPHINNMIDFVFNDLQKIDRNMFKNVPKIADSFLGEIINNKKSAVQYSLTSSSLPLARVWCYPCEYKTDNDWRCAAIGAYVLAYAKNAQSGDQCGHPPSFFLPCKGEDERSSNRRIQSLRKRFLVANAPSFLKIKYRNSMPNELVERFGRNGLSIIAEKKDENSDSVNIGENTYNIALISLI